MKIAIKEFIPPIVFSVARKLRSLKSPLFSSYQEALETCDNCGYEGSDVVKVVVEKNAIYRDKIISSRVIKPDTWRTVMAIGALSPSTDLRVLDFGGGGGYHYSIIRAVLGKEKTIRWNVVETEAMVKAAGERPIEDGLSFFNDMDKAAADLGRIDLIFTSGTLQSTPDPLVFLKKLVSLRAKHLFITRTAFNDGDETITTVQSSNLSSNGPGALPAGFTDREVRYPLTFAIKQKAEAILTEAYDIRFFIDEDKNVYLIQGRPFHMYGYFCDLKEVAN
jgi:putative methyltransferase (TIGR04325 family)